jgi:hypothetical protein
VDEMDKMHWMDLMITIAAIGEHGPLGRTVAVQVDLADLFYGDSTRFGLALRARR